MDAVYNANQLLKQDLGNLKSGTLGMSDAAKRQYAANATQAAGQQIGMQQEALARQAMAQGGATPFAGQAAQLQMNLGQQAANAGAAASQQADQLSQKMAQQEATRIRGDLHAQQDRQRENFWNMLQLGAEGTMGAVNPKTPVVDDLVKKLVAMKKGTATPGANEATPEQLDEVVKYAPGESKDWPHQRTGPFDPAMTEQELQKQAAMPGRSKYDAPASPATYAARTGSTVRPDVELGDPDQDFAAQDAGLVRSNDPAAEYARKRQAEIAAGGQ